MVRICQNSQYTITKNSPANATTDNKESLHRHYIFGTAFSNDTGCVCLFAWSSIATQDMLPTVCSIMDTAQKRQLENHLQRLRTSNLHVIQMVISLHKEHAVITNTICILFSPSRTFFTVFQIWRISAGNHINLFSCQVKGGTSWDWGCHLSSKNKYLMAIILEKKNT